MFNGERREITNPTQSEIGLELDALEPIIPSKHGVSNFVILSKEQPLKNNFQFVQALLKRDGQYLLEARIEYVTGKFEQYQKLTKDLNEAKTVFRMFALDTAPNITAWSDITQKLLASNVKSRRNRQGKLK